MSDVFPESPLSSPPATATGECGCPERDGRIYHQQGSCTDPVVARFGWYASSPPPATATPGQAAREAFGELGADWYPGTPWDGLHDDLRAQWDAAAQAAITAALVDAGVANLHHDRDEALAERDALQRQLDARNRQLAELQTPEVAGIIAGRANARAVVAEMTGRFGATAGSDWVACTTAGQLARWRKRAGLDGDGG